MCDYRFELIRHEAKLDVFRFLAAQYPADRRTEPLVSLFRDENLATSPMLTLFFNFPVVTHFYNAYCTRNYALCAIA